MKGAWLMLAVTLLPGCSSSGGAASTAPPGAGGAQSLGSGGAPIAAPPPIVQQGAGGAPSLSSGGAPSVVTRDETAFEWPEVSAEGGSAHLCEPGHYVGTYECSIVPPPAPGAGGSASTGVGGGPAGFTLTGPVDLTLASESNGEFLEVTGGNMKAAAGFLVLDAPLIGRLSCATGVFEGEIRNGALSIPPFPPGGSATGPLRASFVADGPKLVGTWTLTSGPEFQGWGCSGTWTATRQGP